MAVDSTSRRPYSLCYPDGAISKALDSIWEISANMTLGAIVGEATIVDCVEASDSPWFVGEHGFVLEDAIPYDEPIPLRGQLGLFDVEL